MEKYIESYAIPLDEYDFDNPVKWLLKIGHKIKHVKEKHLNNYKHLNKIIFFSIINAVSSQIDKFPDNIKDCILLLLKQENYHEEYYYQLLALLLLNVSESKRTEYYFRKNYNFDFDFDFDSDDSNLERGFIRRKIEHDWERHQIEKFIEKFLKNNAITIFIENIKTKDEKEKNKNFSQIENIQSETPTKQLKDTLCLEKTKHQELITKTVLSDEKKSFSKTARLQFSLNELCKITHTWTLKHINNFLTNKESIVLYSTSFPSNCSLLKFSIRFVINFNNKFVSLYLHLNKLDENQINNFLKILFSFSVYNKQKNICKTNLKFKKITQNKNFGFENILKIKNFENFDAITIKCKILLDTNCKTQLNKIYSSTETTISTNILDKFSSEIIINNFVDQFLEKCFVESKMFSMPKYPEEKFSIIIKNENAQLNTDYISLYLKYCSNNVTIYNYIWRISILSWDKRPFITGEGNCNFKSPNIALGTKKFILKHDLFDYTNNLLPNDKLTLHVEIYLADLLPQSFELLSLKNNNSQTESSLNKNFEKEDLLVCIDSYNGYVEFYNKQVWKWQKPLSLSFKLPNKQTDCTFKLCDVNKNILFAYGGFDSVQNETTNLVWSCNLSKLPFKWTEMTPMNYCRKSFTSAILNDNIYVFGGVVKNKVSSSCECYDSQQNIWFTIASMIIARHEASAAVYKSSIYIAGGKNENGSTEKSVEKYDPQLNSWILVKPMIEPRCKPSLTFFDERLWAIGSSIIEKKVFVAESYNFVENIWKTEKSSKINYFDLIAINFEENLYAFENDRYNNKIIVSAPKENTWFLISPLQGIVFEPNLIIVPKSCSSIFTDSLLKNSFLTENLLICCDLLSGNIQYHNYYSNSWHKSSLSLKPPNYVCNEMELCGVNDSLIYVFNYNIANNLTLVWSLDFSHPSLNWTALKSFNQFRKAFSSVVFNNTVYVIGGYFISDSKRCCLNSCERYDNQLNVWVTIAPLNTARFEASVVVYNGCIYIAGGESENSFIQNSVEKYDLKSDSWSLVKPMSTPRCKFALTVFDRRLWAIGGWDDSHCTMFTAESYDYVTDKWQKEKPLINKRRNHAAINFHNELYVLGGLSSDLNDKPVEKYFVKKGWVKSSKLIKSVFEPKLIIIPNAYASVFTKQQSDDNFS